MFKVHRVGDRVLFEIPAKELNKDELMVGDAIGKTAPVLVYRNGRTTTVELTPDELTVG